MAEAKTGDGGSMREEAGKGRAQRALSGALKISLFKLGEHG